MKTFLGIALVAACFPVLVYSQLTCHRCYGSGYCNNGTHEDFINDTRTATCDVQTDFKSDLQINNPILNNIQKALNEMTLKDVNVKDNTSLTNVITGHCLTATVHEPHATHTLRTCVTRTTAEGNNQTLCELINEIIDPLNWYQGKFACEACNNSHLCNNYTLSFDDQSEPEPEPDAASSLVVSSVILACSLILSAYEVSL
ncbi:uncharacterized protein [Euwallacea similis]|uniref:uncharacterized protein n=1 Tax=Euwallacea similis TaxID=1736056 RepID=UPI00344F4BFA